MLPTDFIAGTDISDLPSEPLRDLAKEIGIENTIRLWDKLRGRNIAFPANFPRPIIAKWLRKQNKLNISDAAWKLGVSNRTISSIVNAVPVSVKNSGQMGSLF